MRGPPPRQRVAFVGIYTAVLRSTLHGNGQAGEPLRVSEGDGMEKGLANIAAIDARVSEIVSTIKHLRRLLVDDFVGTK